MPTLIKDPSPPRDPKDPIEPNLFFHPNSGNYYAKRFVPGEGRERVLCLDEKNRYNAIQKKNVVLAQWLGTRARKTGGDTKFEAVYFELLEEMEAKAEKTFLAYEGAGRLHILPFFTGKGIEESTRLWPEYKTAKRRENPGRKLKHDRAILRRIFGHAYEKELIDRIPKLALDPFDRATSRTKEISDEEYWRLIEKAKHNPRLTLKLETYMLTGLRANVVRLFRWDWFDWETGEVTIPAEVMKMREDHSVVLDDELLSKYRDRFEKARPVWVFPNRDDNSLPESRTDKGWQRLKKALGIRKKRHGFRAAAASRAIRAGEPGVIVQSGLKMSDRVMRRHYTEANAEDKRKLSSTLRSTLRPKKVSAFINPSEVDRAN